MNTDYLYKSRNSIARPQLVALEAELSEQVKRVEKLFQNPQNNNRSTKYGIKYLLEMKMRLSVVQEIIGNYNE